MLCMGMSFSHISFVEQNPPSLQEQVFDKVYRYHSPVKIFLYVQSEFPILWFAVVCFLLHCLLPPRTVWFQAVGSSHLLPTYIAVRLPSTASLPPPQTLEQRQFWQQRQFLISSNFSTSLLTWRLKTLESLQLTEPRVMSEC